MKFGAPRLSCEVVPRLMAVTTEEWRRLFPDLPDAPEMIRLMDDIGLDGFVFHSLVVRDGDRPILLLPLFETAYGLSALADQRVRTVVDAVSRWLPRLLRPKILGVGFAEGEWGQVGIDPSVDQAALTEAWTLALQSLEALAQGLQADVTAFVNFTPRSRRALPTGRLSGYHELVSLPYGHVSVTFPTLDAYIAGLSSNTRSSLRRKMRRSDDLTVVRTRDPGLWLETIYRYYLSTVERSDVVFGVHRKAYFERVCKAVPGAEYWLYLCKEQLLAFRLVVITPDRFVDKYFGMDPVQGREHNLYFISWLEHIRYCIEAGIPHYYAGQAEEETKARLGAAFTPSVILFRHRRWILHHALGFLGRHLAYTPKVALAPIRPGQDQGLSEATPPLKPPAAHEAMPVEPTRR